MWSPSCILEQRGFQPAIVCKTRVLLIASATVRFIGVAILWGFRSPARPPGSFDGPEGRRGSFFSFNRTSGSCWRCKPVCRVKASIPGAIWATPPAPLPHRVPGHPRLQHRQPKFASSVTRLGESAADRAFASWSLFDVPSTTSRNRLPADCPICASSRR